MGDSKVPQSEAPLAAVCERFATNKALAFSIEAMKLMVLRESEELYRTCNI
jgi:hypothetical protein